jgi:hypothetical protein
MILDWTGVAGGRREDWSAGVEWTMAKKMVR